MSKYDSILNKYPIPSTIKEEIRKELEKLNVTKKVATDIVERCYRTYLANLMEPGEAAGIVAAQSIGEPGTQMSLPYNEKIIIKEGEIIKPVEIGRLVDESIEKYGCKSIRDSEVCEVDGLYVLSLDQDEKVHWKRVLSCIRHRAPEKLISIRTRSGRKIVATPYHSFVVRSNNRITPVKGSELKTGDRIPVVKHMPANCIESVDISEYVSHEYIVNDLEIMPKGGKSLPRELELDFESGYFLGVYLAEGHSTKYFISVSNMNKEVQERVRKFAEKLNLNVGEYDNFSGFAKSHDIRIYSSLLSDFVRQFGKTSKEKKLPSFVFNSDPEFVRGLLQGYFDGDGNINVARKMIRIYSSSKELIDGIALLLSRFGIFSVKRRMKSQYGLVISFRYAELFADRIGSSIAEKRKKLLNLKSSKKIIYDAVDMIPSIATVFIEATRKLNYLTARKFTRKQKIGRATLLRHLDNMDSIAKSQNLNVEELEILRRAVNSDVVWDEIVGIREIECSDSYVYDISVEGLETFMTFDGIITHNTMRTFHYAGVAEIDVTLGLPRLIEILDVRKNPSTPLMTIRLTEEYAKNRKKAREVANRIEATYILDIADVSTDIRNLVIIVNPDEKALRRKGLTVEEIRKKIEKSLKTEVVEEDGKIIVKSEPSYKALMDMFEKLKKLILAGIKEIRRVIIRKEDEEYVLYTEGSNLKKVMKIKGVDFARTATNNIYEIYEVLGIEAARNAVINEAISTLEEQGLEVDVRHIMLVADAMTADGELKQIGRHGVAGEKHSILARAAFEMTVNNLLDAAVRGDRDRLSGVTENIIVGQPIKLGTGDVELVTRFTPVKKRT